MGRSTHCWGWGVTVCGKHALRAFSKNEIKQTFNNFGRACPKRPSDTRSRLQMGPAEEVVSSRGKFLVPT
jgi:hypothetical protein